ncbi:DUF6479 family protein [Streptomyces sp. Z26]|uniref:DUF6479 family protein n=1 Tax=Streptomyces TaxID=1883 RepID=UPI000EF157C2|nr:DUF6479 family protein [Streptomyces sp. Z26]RLL66007.1 hypothetical protein D7M15_02855 [Streptomyces sp. Z26]
MNASATLVPLAVNRDYLVGIAPLVIGIVIVVGLILAVRQGMRLRQSGDMRPSSPSPTPAPAEPVVSEESRLRPDEMPRDGRRRLPHEVRDQGVTGSDDQSPPPPWREGGSGSFGSGGLR